MLFLSADQGLGDAGIWPWLPAHRVWHWGKCLPGAIESPGTTCARVTGGSPQCLSWLSRYLLRNFRSVLPQTPLTLCACLPRHSHIPSHLNVLLTVVRFLPFCVFPKSKCCVLTFASSSVPCAWHDFNKCEVKLNWSKWFFIFKILQNSQHKINQRL